MIVNVVYMNSLLATLNARKKIWAAASQSNIKCSRDLSRDISFSLKQLPKNASVGGTQKNAFLLMSKTFIFTQRPTNISIKIDTTKEYTRSDDKTEVRAL